jgi:hypothetical protein
VASRDCFGSGVNWLHGLQVRVDERADEPRRDLPPMFGYDRCVYQGVENGDELGG